MIEARWKKDTEAELRTQWGRAPFVSVDPGANGALVQWNEAGVKPAVRMVFSWSSDVHTAIAAAHAVHREGGPGGPVVVEDQFVGANPSTAVTQARRAAYFVGALAGLWGFPLHVVRVSPATWQRHYGPGSGDKKEEVLECAMRHGMQKHMLGLTANRCSGIADAWGIGHAWRKVVSRG